MQNIMNLRPSEIYFSQAEINSQFDRRSDHPYNVGQTLDMLMDGQCTVYDIPTLSVMWRDDKWVTADNRRLWVFRHLEKLGKCSTIPVRETGYIDFRKLNSTTGGRTVRFYSGRYAIGRWHQLVDTIDPQFSAHIIETRSRNEYSYNDRINNDEYEIVSTRHITFDRTENTIGTLRNSQSPFHSQNYMINNTMSVQATVNTRENDTSAGDYEEETVNIDDSNTTDEDHKNSWWELCVIL